jgi:hypothetical protein
MERSTVQSCLAAPVFIEKPVSKPSSGGRQFALKCRTPRAEAVQAWHRIAHIDVSGASKIKAAFRNH